MEKGYSCNIYTSFKSETLIKLQISLSQEKKIHKVPSQKLSKISVV